MFKEIFISPVLFVEAMAGCLILPKLTSVNPVYGNAASGSILTGLAIVGIIPQIDTFWGHVVVLITMFILFCAQTIVDNHNTRKTISLWTNCAGMSCYGLMSGLSMSLVFGYEFVRYATSLAISILAVSYSMGHRYIEYITESNDRLPLVLYSLSTPLGLIAGRYSGLSAINSDLLLGASAGTFLTVGIQGLLSHSKTVQSLYLETEPIKPNSLRVCASVLAGLTIAGILQSSLFTLALDELSDTGSNSTIFMNTTNSTV
jgi:hypothetical protein